MNLSRNTCGECGDREALFVGRVSRCCQWELPRIGGSEGDFNYVRTNGRPPKLTDAQRKAMRARRKGGAEIKVIASEFGMSISQTRVICRGSQSA
jgi:hypothetical protein